VSKVKCLQVSDYDYGNSYMCREINSAEGFNVSHCDQCIGEEYLFKSVREAVKKAKEHEQEFIYELIEDFNDKKALYDKYIQEEEPNSVRFIRDEQ